MSTAGTGKLPDGMGFDSWDHRCGFRKITSTDARARAALSAHLKVCRCGPLSPGMCPKHPAFEADNCPGCGTSAKIGG